MMIDETIREKVRQRANFSCEFCGVDETDTGGRLTIDHFHPKSKGGDNRLDNLLYCCIRCNQYKFDYWPRKPSDPGLWNPRQDPAIDHFLSLGDGTLHPLTPTGAFTLRRLRLNRPPLIAHRLNKRRNMENTNQLLRYRELTRVLNQLSMQQAILLEEQRILLKEQRNLLRFLLDRAD